MHALWKKANESFLTSIRRIDSEIAIFKSLGGEQSDYELNALLRAGADPELKAKQYYTFMRNQLFEVLPRPDQGVGGSNQ